MKECGYKRRRTGKDEKEREGKMRRKSNRGKEKVGNALSSFCKLELLKELKKRKKLLYISLYNKFLSVFWLFRGFS